MTFAAKRMAKERASEPAGLARCSPCIKRLYAHWLESAGARNMPARGDMDLAHLGDLAPHVMFVRLVDDERRFVYEYVGAQEVLYRGKDPTGLSVAQGFMGPSREQVVSAYEKAAGSGQIFIDEERFRAPSGWFMSEDVIYLPLSDDGKNVTHILAMGSESGQER